MNPMRRVFRIRSISETEAQCNLFAFVGTGLDCIEK